MEDALPMAVLESAIHDVLWADAEVERATVDYDAVVLTLRETTGRRVDVRCSGYIGLRTEGFWDEIVVEAADLVEAHPFMDRCLDSLTERLGESRPASGSPARNGGEYSTLVVTLADGCRILCVAAAFEASTAA